MPKAAAPADVDKFAWTGFTIIKKPKAEPVEAKGEQSLAYRARLRTYDGFDLGGEGSGNFGHAGRPGEVGGSGKGDGKADAKASREALRAETAPGGRFATFEKRTAVRQETQQQLRELLPSGASAVIANATPQQIRTGEKTVEVLKEMKAAGLKMPDHVMIISVPSEHLNAAVSGKTLRQKDKEGKDIPGTERLERTLIINIPDTLPHDIPLDDAAKAVFGKPSDISPKHAFGDPDYTTYDKFAARNMKDVIVHEMGHVQAGPRRNENNDRMSSYLPMAKLMQTGKFADTDAIRRAACRVSEYARENENEFLAECFVRLYRGEKLAADSQAMYDALGGPEVPAR